MGEDADWLEAVLRKKTYEESPIKVIEMKSNSFLSKGDNYMSQIRRIEAKVVLGSGKQKRISFIVKSQHETEQMKKMSMEAGVFFREISMYRDIFPMVEDLLEQVNDEEGIFWPRCYDYRLSDRLVFEDLAPSGYKMVDRKKQLGLPAALLVLRQLAKYHALSRILLSRAKIPVDVFKTHFWKTNPVFANGIIQGNLQRLVGMMKSWGPEWSDGVERLEKFLPNALEKFLDAFEVKPDEFAVLTHGDCWTNNLLFQYGDDPEHPTAVKLLDWQVSCILPPSRDLHYFFASSVRQDIQEDPEQFDQLLQTYCTVLKEWLLKFNYEGTIPDVAYIKNSLKERAFYALEVANGLVPIVLGEANKLLESEEAMEIMKKELEAIGKGEPITDLFKNFADLLNPTCLQIIQTVTKRTMEWGLF